MIVYKVRILKFVDVQQNLREKHILISFWNICKDIDFNINIPIKFIPYESPEKIIYGPRDIHASEINKYIYK